MYRLQRGQSNDVEKWLGHVAMSRRCCQFDNAGCVSSRKKSSSFRAAVATAATTACGGGSSGVDGERGGSYQHDTPSSDTAFIVKFGDLPGLRGAAAQQLTELWTLLVCMSAGMTLTWEPVSYPNCWIHSPFTPWDLPHSPEAFTTD